MSLLTNLVSYYRFNGNLLDATGAYPGSTTGVYVTGKSGSGITPNTTGTTSILGVSLGTQWSFSVWVNNPNQVAQTALAPTYTGYVVGYAVFGSSEGLFWEQDLATSQSRLNFYVAGHHYSPYFTAPSAYVHVVVTYNAGALSMYRDNALVASYTIPAFTTFNAAGTGYGAFAPLNGSFDELAFWWRELSAGDVAELYSAGAGNVFPFNPTNELSFLPMDSGRHAFKVWSTVEKEGTTPSAAPSIPPVITLVSPTLGAIGLQTAIALETTDEANAFKRIVLVAEFPTSKIKEIVYDGAGFGPMYTNAANVRTTITNGYHFDILRDGGWIANDGPVLTPFVIDTSGGEAA